MSKPELKRIIPSICVLAVSSVRFQSIDLQSKGVGVGLCVAVVEIVMIRVRDSNLERRGYFTTMFCLGRFSTATSSSFPQEVCKVLCPWLVRV